MSHRISTDDLGYNKNTRQFYTECSDLRGAKCEPKALRDGWEIEVYNPKTNRSEVFRHKNGDSVRNQEGEVEYDIFRSTTSDVTLKIFND
jgi:hypothetical protein